MAYRLGGMDDYADPDGGPELLIDHPVAPRPLGELLPEAFGPDDLARR